MIKEVEELLSEHESLEREYYELVHVSGEMDLNTELFRNLILVNIAHSLAVIADHFTGRRTDETD